MKTSSIAPAFRGALDKPKNRFRVDSLNLTNRQNAHEGSNNFAALRFGQFAGFDRRIDGLVIDVVD